MRAKVGSILEHSLIISCVRRIIAVPTGHGRARGEAHGGGKRRGMWLGVSQERLLNGEVRV